MMNIGIIGAGLIAHKRAAALPKNVKLKLVCDLNLQRAQEFGKEFNCGYTQRWEELVTDSSIGACIICTSNNVLIPSAIAALKTHKHVLLEKPGATNLTEFKKLLAVAKKQPLVVQIGYNHRFHPAIEKAKQLCESGKYGPVLFIRAKYGHGGRLGYEKEWRFDPKIAGGGELLDQGSHLIDLTNLFMGQANQVLGLTAHLFWQAKLEDSSFLILKNKTGQIAQLSATAVEWKNIFVFEIVLKTAKIQINGLGRSYGAESLALYKMRPEMGPPDVEEFAFDQTDLSWKKENESFFKAIAKKDYANHTLQNAAYVLKTIDTIYTQNK